MKVCEIFSSIQGESSYAGLPCTFVRLTGCNLRCSYCDTTYAYEEGDDMTVVEILDSVRQAGIRLVEITGGEPLLQTDAQVLMQTLLDDGFRVLIETSGSVSTAAVDSRAVVILDIKTPGSGMADRMDLENLDRLRPQDEVKFVITSRDDYAWARRVIAERGLTRRCSVLFSAAFGMVEPSELVGWIVEDRLDVRFNPQIHKYIFGPDKRRV